jgi:hypothetical protein
MVDVDSGDYPQAARTQEGDEKFATAVTPGN